MKVNDVDLAVNLAADTPSTSADPAASAEGEPFAQHFARARAELSDEADDPPIFLPAEADLVAIPSALPFMDISAAMADEMSSLDEAVASELPTVELPPNQMDAAIVDDDAPTEDTSVLGTEPMYSAGTLIQANTAVDPVAIASPTESEVAPAAPTVHAQRAPLAVAPTPVVLPPVEESTEHVPTTELTHLFDTSPAPTADPGIKTATQVDRLSPIAVTASAPQAPKQVDTSDVDNISRYLMREAALMRGTPSSAGEGLRTPSTVPSQLADTPASPAVPTAVTQATPVVMPPQTTAVVGRIALEQVTTPRSASIKSPALRAQEADDGPALPVNAREWNIDPAVQWSDLIEPQGAAAEQVDRLDPTFDISTMVPSTEVPEFAPPASAWDLPDNQVAAAEPALETTASRAEAQQILNEAIARFRALQSELSLDRRLNIDLRTDAGTSVRLVIQPEGDQHRIAFLVGHDRLRDELRRSLPEIREAATHFPVDVADISVEQFPPQGVGQEPINPAVNQQERQGDD